METVWKRLDDALDLAIDDAQYWENVCNEVVDIFGATGAILIPTDPSFRGVWMSCSTRLKLTLGEYIEGGWHLRDPREKVTALMLEHGYSTDDEIFPDRAAKAEMPFYKDFLYKHNFGVLTAIRILTPNRYWGLMLHFANDHPPISEAEIALIGKIRPILEKAVTKADEIAHRRIAAFAHFFKGTKSEVYVMDVDGEQCFNLDNDGKLSNQINASDLLPKEMSNELNDEIKEICASDPELSLSKSFQFRERGENTNVLVIQFPPSLRHYFMAFKVCAITTECSDMDSLKHNRLRENYQLSETEIATVDLLSTGKTPNMIADLMSLKAASIRQRLKVIYQKTNVSSQVELVALYGQL
ncbi:DNA-binding protein with HTH domain [Hoeflea sp. IMCC20628]|uniref:helix-turn-helix transcriptional regulator n=1 Tax=Hoeflea sp. IMCC20628 TaxID=1620421 RepID=UPI00063AF006|nr:LuxR C-terminal-related transcriptional regulator [Hoeflea sp. IMCC20628]AKI01619.1 DNA-binding protein with HTH domain [Hoeflea sp. IMCC20628]